MVKAGSLCLAAFAALALSHFRPGGGMKQPTVDKFLSAYAAPVREIGRRARASLMKYVPGCAEDLDAGAKVIGYGYGPGYSDIVCVLIVSKSGVKLGLPE